MFYVKAYVALGGNVGDVIAAFKKTIQALNELNIRVLQTSRLFRTKAWSPYDEIQDDYWNMACEVETTLSASDLLRTLLKLENQAGRVRKQQSTPRPLDLDILLYGNEVIHLPGLQIPHPRMLSRAFVLLPLLDIAADIEIPGHSLTVRQAVENLSDPNAEILEIVDNL